MQLEQHVEQCTLIAHLRDTHGFTSLNYLFSDRFPPDITCKVIHDILSGIIFLVDGTSFHYRKHVFLIFQAILRHFSSMAFPSQISRLQHMAFQSLRLVNKTGPQM